MKGLSALAVLIAFSAPASAQVREDYPIQAVPFTDVHFADAFWAPRMETNRSVTIPYAFEKCEETGRIDNFAKAGGLMEGEFEGIYFNDSDVFKVIEGAAYALSLAPDPELDAYLDDLIAKIAAAQEDDGYLYTSRTLSSPDNMPPGGPERWSNIDHGHELYNVGHMYEAAVAHYMATDKRSLLDVAIKNADLICSVFGPGKLPWPPGHQEIEIGLGKLYRTTGDRKYLEMAKFFLDARGREVGRHLYGQYSQDHVPVVEQEGAVGHSVRAAYLYSGMADIAALTADPDYVTAIDRIWNDVVGRKMYLTGGIGAAGGIEGFGEGYDLPNRTAYAETCAAIANAMWNHRMFLRHGDAKYVDVLERVIYNGFLSGVALEGNTFFYPNPLSSLGGARSPWFGCACCPSNVCRFVPSIPGYAYAHRGDELYVNLFVGGTAEIALEGGVVRVEQETEYPWQGDVALTVHPAEAGRTFSILVRIPGWARNRPVPSDLYRYAKPCSEGSTLSVNGEAVEVTPESGFARLTREWQDGDVIRLHLPMPVRRVLCHEEVEANVDMVAIERGPLVYCAEAVDNPGGGVLDRLVPGAAELRAEHRADLLGGITVITFDALGASRGVEGNSPRLERRELTLIPYYAWAHRERGAMTVWLARALSATSPGPAPTIAHTSTVTVSGGGPVSALTSQLEPKSSGDHTYPFFHWWPRKGTKEWVQYDFAKAETVSSVSIYWFDDTGRGQCRLPVSWELFRRDGEEWQPVTGASGYGVEIDAYNVTTFDAVTTKGLRLEVQLPGGFSAGIHEWSVR